MALIGPRQVGKTTLAFDVAKELNALYIDLERPRDLAKISDFEQFCALNADKILVLDEIQRAPELFPNLRGIIDERRRPGKKFAQFLLLGSASIELLKQSSESLAGRIAQCELFSFTIGEVTEKETYALWNRGGFPESFLANNDEDSLSWRQNFINTTLERDIPLLGPRIPAETYIRDSGICHALLGIETLNDLLGHPVVSGSWEGFVIENLIASLPNNAFFGYYRTTGGAEIDLVIELNAKILAIEI